jgi:hypothetical protein
VDIHKPKPWHGLREFLKEYVIIVVGVLTALGAEQAVEAVHTAQKANEAEALVREEMARNVLFSQQRVMIYPCNREQYRAVQRALLATPADQPVAQFPYLFITTYRFNWVQWESATASGIAGHFPEDRRLAYERMYITGAGVRSLETAQTSELDAAAKLRTLRLPARKLDPVTRETLLQASEQGAYQEEAIAHNAGILIQHAAPLHLPPLKLSPQTKILGPADAQACMDRVRAEEASLPPLQGTLDPGPSGPGRGG